MTGARNILREWVVYGVILTLAIILGYLLSNPLSLKALAAVGMVLLILITPILLRFHHPILIASWNMTAVVGFLPGRPQLWLVMAFTSLMIFLIRYAMVRNVQFDRARSILYPLLFLGVVVFVTAELNGGIGVKVLGSENIGGKRYLYIFGAIAGYMAMTAARIPNEKAVLYVGLFLLGSMTNAIGNLLPYAPTFLYPLFIFFPVEHQGLAAVMSQESVTETFHISRMEGFSVAMMALAWFLVARQGLGPLLRVRKVSFWVLVLATVLSLFGGYRSAFLFTTATFVILFFLEGLHHTRKMPVLVVTGVLVFVGLIATMQKLPASVQRSLSILPLVKVDPVVEYDAKGSSEWRIQMWQALLPQVPKYLLLGKGLGFDREEHAQVVALEQGRFRSADIAAEAWILTGDYHNGPLTVLIPFGLWGGLGLAWLFVAGIRGLHYNRRYGDPSLRTLNTFLFAFFLTKVVMYLFVFGNFYSDLTEFVGILGLSVALNDGIRKPAPGPEGANASALKGPLARPRLIPSFTHLDQR